MYGIVSRVHCTAMDIRSITHKIEPHISKLNGTRPDAAEAAILMVVKGTPVI